MHVGSLPSRTPHDLSYATDTGEAAPTPHSEFDEGDSSSQAKTPSTVEVLLKPQNSHWTRIYGSMAKPGRRFSLQPVDQPSNFAGILEDEEEITDYPSRPSQPTIDFDSSDVGTRSRQTSELLLGSLITSLREAHGITRVKPRRKLAGSTGSGVSSFTHTVASMDGLVVNQTDDHMDRITPTWVAGWNVSNLIQGIGILGVPYACVHAGWVSIPAMLLVAAVCCFTGRLLAECLYRYPERHCENYFTASHQLLGRIRVRSTIACIAEDVFHKAGSRIAGLAVIIELFGASVLYIILLGQSASALINPRLQNPWPISIWSAIMTYACIPILLYPRMRVIAWFSLFAIAGLLGTLILVMVYCILEFPTGTNVWANLPAPKWQELPVSLSIIIFSYCAHGALPGIEASMARPESYPKMLRISFTIAGVSKVIFGLLAALVLGGSVAQAVTDSMTARPGLLIVVHLTVLLNVFFSIPLVFYILGEQFDCSMAEFVPPGFMRNRKFCSIYTIWFVSTRLAMINLAVICATMVPHFALVMGMVGALTGSLLCFIFPALFHIMLFRPHLSYLSIAGRIAVVVFGAVVCVTGVIFSGMSIAEQFNSGE